MIDLAHFPLFLAAALLIAVVPGPGIFYVAARSLAGGPSEGKKPSGRTPNVTDVCGLFDAAQALAVRNGIPAPRHSGDTADG